MKIMIFNGLLLFLLFMWTSAETGPETVLTEEIQVYANESRVDIQARKRACENLGGKCIKKKKDCPSRWHLETKPGKPYCSKNHRCCYPGPSCNLVWNYKEERPLIMIRDSKIIVPPVLDIEVSDNPSRIPIGRKLIFACPGKNNQFNHVEGTHTKLHGECISHEQFKVCVNSNPEILDLSQLSCGGKMFPSFIKDNDTSDKKSCDGIGGELYKTGYTYGDYHEFKDLEIEVCFHQKNQTTLCTSPNLNGKRTGYRTSRGFFTGPINEPPGRDTRMPCGPDVTTHATTWNGVQCVFLQGGIRAECSLTHGTFTSGHEWCYTGGAGPGTDDWDYCTGYCTDAERLNQGEFETRHKCVRVNAGNNDGDPCRTDVHGQPSVGDALAFVRSRSNAKGRIFHSFNDPAVPFQIAYIQRDDGQGKEDVCIMVYPVQSWECLRPAANQQWAECENIGNCRGGFAVFNGHLASKSRFCP